MVFLRKLTRRQREPVVRHRGGEAGGAAAGGGRAGPRDPADARVGRGGRGRTLPRPVVPGEAEVSAQLGLFSATAAAAGVPERALSEVVARLKAVDPDELSPRAAHDLLAELAKKLTPGS